MEKIIKPIFLALILVLLLGGTMIDFIAYCAGGWTYQFLLHDYFFGPPDE